MAIDHDLLEKLEAGLSKVGLEPKMIAIMKGKLSLKTRGDHLPLPSTLRHLATKAARLMTKRSILEFVEGIVDQLIIVMEEEASKRRRPRPGGPRGVWDQFPEELRPPSSQGSGDDPNIVRLLQSARILNLRQNRSADLALATDCGTVLPLSR